MIIICILQAHLSFSTNFGDYNIKVEWYCDIREENT